MLVRKIRGPENFLENSDPCFAFGRKAGESKSLLLSAVLAYFGAGAGFEVSGAGLEAAGAGCGAGPSEATCTLSST